MLAKKGRYYVAFIDRPFFASTSALASAGTARGFDSVIVAARDDVAKGQAPFLATLVPQGPADDSWNTIAFGRWSREEEEVMTPSQVKTVRELAASSPGSSTPPASSCAGLLTPEQCGAPWRAFTLAVTGFALVVGAGVGFVVGRRKRG